MAVHTCSNCGHEEHIFGAGGGERIAREYGAELLGSLPLDLSIRATTDSGLPTVAADLNSSLSGHYRRIARRLSANLWQGLPSDQQAPEIVITDDEVGAQMVGFGAKKRYYAAPVILPSGFRETP